MKKLEKLSFEENCEEKVVEFVLTEEEENEIVEEIVEYDVPQGICAYCSRSIVNSNFFLCHRSWCDKKVHHICAAYRGYKPQIGSFFMPFECKFCKRNM